MGWWGSFGVVLGLVGVRGVTVGSVVGALGVVAGMVTRVGAWRVQGVAGVSGWLWFR